MFYPILNWVCRIVKDSVMTVLLVSGHISGLQKKINDIESHTLYVHCSTHTLNLVEQDAMMTVEKSRNFLCLMKSI